MKKVCILFMILVGLFITVPQVLAVEPILIGYNGMRSGPGKHIGDNFILGINIAIKEITNNGGILGRPIKLVVEDNQMKPQIALQKLKKLILKDKVEAVFGGGTSAAALAISKAMPRYKKIFMPTGLAMDLTGKYFNPYIFRATANVAQFVKSMALYMGEYTQFKKVYLINQDYSYGHDIADLYEKFIKEVGPDTQIVGKDFHPISNKDFAPYMSKVKASGADYVLTGNWGTDASRLIIQSRSFGLSLPVAGIILVDPNILRAMPGDQAVGSFGIGIFLPGLDTPKARKFEDSFYKTSGGIWPYEQVYMSYLIMMMYAEAVNKAGSLDVEQIIKAFEGLKWEGPTGTVTMRAKDHQAIQPIVIGQVVKKTKYFNFPYVKPIHVIPAEELDYKPEDFGWKPYKGK